MRFGQQEVRNPSMSWQDCTRKERRARSCCSQGPGLCSLSGWGQDKSRSTGLPGITNISHVTNAQHCSNTCEEMTSHCVTKTKRSLLQRFIICGHHGVRVGDRALFQVRIDTYAKQLPSINSELHTLNYAAESIINILNLVLGEEHCGWHLPMKTQRSPRTPGDLPMRPSK